MPGAGTSRSAPTMRRPCERAETVLLPAFDSWRSGGGTDAAMADGAKPGTLDWVFAEYRADRRFTQLDAQTRRNHEVGFRLVGGYTMKDGRRLGMMPVDVDHHRCRRRALREALGHRHTDGLTRERRTTINHAMKTCRRAWNVAARRNPGKLPLVNPFAKMGLKASDRETPTATFEELQAFRAKAIELGHPSLATAALIGWEWLQRERDIFARSTSRTIGPRSGRMPCACCT